MLPELGSLAAYTRDDRRYNWERLPEGHNAFGLFAIGPQEARPWWFSDVRTGDANLAPSTESREAVLARADEMRRSRLRRMGLATSGVFTGRNRSRRAA